MTDVLPALSRRIGWCERLAARVAVARIWRHDRSAGRLNLHVLLALLVVSFLVVPVLLFAQFHAERRGDEALLLKAMRDQLTTIGSALSVEIRESGLSSYSVLDERLKLLTPADMRIKILYRPNEGRLNNAFLYVATSAAIDPVRLEEERVGLVNAGPAGLLGDRRLLCRRRLSRYRRRPAGLATTARADRVCGLCGDGVCRRRGSAANPRYGDGAAQYGRGNFEQSRRTRSLCRRQRCQ